MGLLHTLPIEVLSQIRDCFQGGIWGVMTAVLALRPFPSDDQ